MPRRFDTQRTDVGRGFRDRLLRALDWWAELRARGIEDAAFGEWRKRLRACQAAHHARALEGRRFPDAAQFFLTDLYGPSELSSHIEDVRRIVPVMTSLLPDSGLATAARGRAQQALGGSRPRDGRALGAKAKEITDTAYAEAYLSVGRADDGRLPIDLIALLGAAIDRLTVPSSA